MSKDLSYLIQKKINSTRPYYGSSTIQVLTDYDVFPYQRWWKGKTGSENPIIADRVAGYKKINNACYMNMCAKKCASYPEGYPCHLFQTPCSTVKPCFIC